MDERELLAQRFEENRRRLRGVAYRMLGSTSEADDAVQEAWLRLSRSDTSAIENLAAWLTTVVARVCLDMLRSRASRREESFDAQASVPLARSTEGMDPEQEALLADSVGLALLVVFDRLAPAERLAFVLHDMFAVPFEDIASVLGKSAAAARQLASRARRRVQGTSTARGADLAQQREVVEAFVAAVRSGDFERLVAVLDPDVVVRLDEGAGGPGAPREIHGARNWARGALAFSQALRFTEPAIIDGSVGLVYAPGGRLLRALQFEFTNGKIVHAHIIADPARLRELSLGVLREA